MPISKIELDKMGCCDPNCKDPQCGKLYFHSRCHPKSPTYTYYVKGSGVLTIVCAKCDQTIAEVAIMGYGVQRVQRDENAPIKSPILLNAAQQQEQHPNTFERPSEERLKAVSEGDYVKVCLPRKGADGTEAERFWALVRVIMGDGKMWAQVDNDLDPDCGLNYTDMFWMHEDNIYDIHKKGQA